MFVQTHGAIQIRQEEIAEAITLTASPTTDYFEIALASTPCPGSTRTVTITTNAGNSWTVSKSSIWLSTSPTSGTGSGTVTISTTKGSGSRTGYLYIASSAPTATVTVIQQTCA